MAQDKSSLGRLGVVLAAAGSAVGLGNIWKFPYMTGENGGAAFLIIYLACVLFFGVPLMSTEFYVGRQGLKKWPWIRPMTAIFSLLFLSFYLIVTGWCLHYLFHSVVGTLAHLDSSALDSFFVDYVSGAVWLPILWVFVAILLTAIVEFAGVKSGIERVCKVMMPLLFVILIVLIIRGLTLPGSMDGVKFLFEPDFSKVSPKVILNAMGQCFFSLSIGAGALATYSGYMSREQNIVGTVEQVVGIDTIVAILAGVAIFPAVFALGINPSEGPQLVFVSLPSVFNGMAGGYIFQLLFFLLLTIAALSSTISLLETQLNFYVPRLGWKRSTAIIVCSLVVFVIASLAICSTLLFDVLDNLVSIYMLPMGGMIFSVYVGWICPKEDVICQLTPSSGRRSVALCLYGLIRYAIPPIILLIFLNALGVF